MIHLNELCRKLGIKLHLREDGLYVLIVKADEEVEMMFENSPWEVDRHPQRQSQAHGKILFAVSAMTGSWIIRKQRL